MGSFLGGRHRKSETALAKMLEACEAQSWVRSDENIGSCLEPAPTPCTKPHTLPQSPVNLKTRNVYCVVLIWREADDNEIAIWVELV